MTSDEEAHKTIISINEDTMSRVSHKDETKEHLDVKFLQMKPFNKTKEIHLTTK